MYRINSSSSPMARACLLLPAPPFVRDELNNNSRKLTYLLVFSGARNFELLSPEEQEFACNTTVQYAPRAYEWIRNCKASADGLTIESLGREKAFNELLEWNWEEVQAFPVCTKSLCL